MLILATTSALVQLQTSAAGAISVHATFVDNNAGVVNPNAVNTASITTATTTTIVASPAASTQRNVQTLTIKNTSASVANTVTVTHVDGQSTSNTATIYAATLQPNEEAQFVWGDGWRTFDTNGAVKTALLSPAMSTANFSTGTSSSALVWNQHIRVTSTTAGPKTFALPSATGSGGLIEIEDAGALAANPTGLITVTGTTINGLAVLSVQSQVLAFRDVGVNQISSV